MIRDRDWWVMNHFRILEFWVFKIYNLIHLYIPIFLMINSIRIIWTILGKLHSWLKCFPFPPIRKALQDPLEHPCWSICERSLNCFRPCIIPSLFWVRHCQRSNILHCIRWFEPFRYFFLNKMPSNLKVKLKILLCSQLP